MRIPPGYTTVFPYLVVDGAAAAIDFLVAGLGAIEIGRTVGVDGRIRNARLRFGDTTVMVSDATAEHPARPSHLYLYVENADAAVARAVAAGGRLVMAVADMPYGDRQGGVEDPGGTIWWLSERLVEGDYEGDGDD